MKTLMFEQIFDPPLQAFPGMAPTEKSPGRLVGKINWRINEVVFTDFNQWR